MHATLRSLVFCVLFAPAALAQDAGAQLNNLLGKKGNAALGQAVVVATLLGCTQKTAGRPATEAFYKDMQAVGKTIEGYCKQNQPEKARELLLSTLDAKKNDPVYRSALVCYDNQAASIAPMGGQKMADDMARYAAWAKDPAQARQSIHTNDIRKHSQVAEGNPHGV